MALICAVGELGAGKTLCLTYLAFRNWYLKDRRLFANYTLFGMPFYRLKTIKQLDMIRDGFVAVDEVWLWGLDSRCSQRKVNRIMGNILARSRKRKLTYGFTVQTMSQLDKRLAKVLDFIAYPILNRTETICKLVVCDITRKPLKVFRFRTAPIFKMYKTDEEVSEILDDVTGSKSKKNDEAAYDAGRPKKLELPFREPEADDDDDKLKGSDEDRDNEDN